jgi:hypothetical protein
MEDDMDLAGATLGASGFRRANSWLKRAHMNIMHGMEEAYHNKNRKAAEAAIEFAKQNLYAALEMLAKLDEYLVNYNYAMAKVYKAVAQVYQEAQGIRNYIDMETYKIKKGAEITEDKIETKTDIAIMNADVRQMVLLFEANKILVMAKWEAEIKRIADRYAVEEMNKQLDDADRKLVISNAQARIQEYYNMLSQEVTYDANTLESKVKAMSVDIAAKQSMITSVGQSSLGLNTTVIQ